MNPPTNLSGAQLRTFQTIFQHPVSHNLQWRDVHGMFRHLGQVEEEANGSLKVTYNRQTLVLPAPRKKDVSDAEDVMKIRHFLERCGLPVTATTGTETHCLVLIDHHQARIFHSELPGSTGEQMLPHSPDDYFRHAPSSKNFSRGQEKPDPNTFFKPVAQALKGVGQILLFGNGTGTGSEMEQFVLWLHTHHEELAKRIIGTLTVDSHHLTDDQLLAKAREFYAHPQKPPLALA